ncbi:UvrD-helicase domain-containing protein [Neisseria sp. 74A18]|uniref:UvrD-helicase domain-containing protein n=1 Tax=Neisseria sp. 74A18 TaxID=1696094 RepID=UPI0006CAD626|nr:UvrD-helicase domain-containing protein [Neisseria sp. 74A18]KPN73527.1 hypothetical protein AKG43_07565 [Neisseria sp. 74A18]
MEPDDEIISELSMLFPNSQSSWVRFSTKFKKKHFIDVLKETYRLGYEQGNKNVLESPRESRELNISFNKPNDYVELEPDTAIYGPEKFPVTKKLVEEMKGDTQKAVDAGLVSMPTEEQWEMILSDHPASNVTAGAGSGKSTTLVLRVIFMICYLNININEVKIISFTRASCDELREKIKKVLTFPIWEKKSSLNDVDMDKLLKDLVKTFHASLASVAKRQYKSFDFFEFLKNKSLESDILTQDDCENFFLTNVDGVQKEKLLEVYRSCFTEIEKFRNAIMQLFHISISNKKFKLSKTSNSKPYGEYVIKTAANRDLQITNLVNSYWIDDIQKSGIDLKLKPEQIFTENGNSFYCNAVIKIKDQSVPIFFSLNGKKDDQELVYNQNDQPDKLSLKNALIVKRNLILNFITSDYYHIEDVKDLKNLQFLLLYGEEVLSPNIKAPRFNIQLDGELNESPIEELLFAQASFIQNLGMEVQIPINHISNKRLFKKSDAEFHFATALQYFMPHFEEFIGNHKVITFNRLFLNGANQPETLPSTNQLLKFRHLLIDEFQDISPQIVKWILAIHRKLADINIDPSIMAIGDDWQSIYGWRGSAPELFIHFEEHFPISSQLESRPAKYKMMKNFRSVEPILKDAEKILRDIRVKVDKQAEAVRQNDIGCKGIEIVNNIDFKKTNDIQKVVNRIILEYQWASSLDKSDKNKVLVMARTRKVLDAVKKELNKKMRNIRDIKFFTFHQSKGLQAEVAILCGDCRYDLNHKFRNAVYESCKIFSQTYDQAAKDEAFRLAYVATTRGIRRTIWFIEEFYQDGAAIQLKRPN